MTSISTVIPPEDADEVAKALAAAGIPSTKATGQGFDGAEVISLVVNLTPHVATFLAGLYAERLRANRYTMLKTKGRGVSEATLLKLAHPDKDGSGKS
jgi:hypothetical protein